MLPWLIVAVLALLAVHIGDRITAENERLEQEKQKAVKKESPPVNVITLLVQPGPLSDSITLPAEIAPEQELWIKAEVSGRIVETLADEGAKLTKGQRIVKLDDRDYRSRLKRIDAAYSLARTEYKRSLALARTNATAQATLDDIEARLKELEAQKNEAALALERTEIRAPIPCILNELKARKGDFVAIGDPVAQVLNIDPVKVVVGVPESDVTAVSDIKEADVTIPALDGRKVVAKKFFYPASQELRPCFTTSNWELPTRKAAFFRGCSPGSNLLKKRSSRRLRFPCTLF